MTTTMSPHTISYVTDRATGTTIGWQLSPDAAIRAQIHLNQTKRYAGTHEELEQIAVEAFGETVQAGTLWVSMVDERTEFGEKRLYHFDAETGVSPDRPAPIVIPAKPKPIRKAKAGDGDAVAEAAGDAVVEGAETTELAVEGTAGPVFTGQGEYLGETDAPIVGAPTEGELTYDEFMRQRAALKEAHRKRQQDAAYGRIDSGTRLEPANEITQLSLDGTKSARVYRVP